MPHADADLPPAALPATVCPLCGGANQCTPAATGRFDTPCWCATATMAPEALARIPPEQLNRACLCPRCAAGIQAPGSPQP